MARKKKSGVNLLILIIIFGVFACGVGVIIYTVSESKSLQINNIPINPQISISPASKQRPISTGKILLGEVNLIQGSYSTDYLQLYSPQCVPAANNQGLHEKDCIYLFHSTDSLPIILFVSYYPDSRFTKLEDYKQYLITNNFAQSISNKSIGKDGSFMALEYTPLKSDNERKQAIQEYAIFSDNSLIVIDLFDKTNIQTFNQIISTLEVSNK